MNKEQLAVWWETLTEAPVQLGSVELRRQAQLFSALILFFVPCAAANLLLLILRDPSTALLETPLFIITVIGNLISWLTYALSRTRYFRYGIYFFVLAASFIIILSVVLNPTNPDTIYWLVIPILLAGLLLPPLVAFVLALIQIISVLFLPLFVSNISLEYVQFAALSISGISGLFLLFSTLRRQELITLQVEREQMAEMGQQLRQKQESLEERVEERTQSLRIINKQLTRQIAERLKMEQQLSDRNRELLLLNQVLKATASNLSTEQILTVACAELSQALNLPRSAAIIFSEDQQTVTVVAEYLAHDEGSIRGLQIKITDVPIVAEFLSHRQPVVFDNLLAGPDLGVLQTVVTDRKIEKVLTLPLFVHGDIVGLIAFGVEANYHFTAQEVHLGGAVAAAISQSLYTAKLYAAEREQRALTEALLDTARLFGNELQLEELLGQVLDHVSRVIPYNSANIMLVEDNMCRLVCGRGYKPTEVAWLQQISFPLDVPTLLQMRESHRPCWLPDTSQSALWEAIPATEHIRSFIGAPMFVENELIGFIQVDGVEPNQLTPVHVGYLQAFANQLGLVMHNFKLHTRLRQYAEELEQRVARRTAELAQANEELRTLAQVKDEFVANISHELRTPITNLILRQTLLEKMPEKQAKHLDVMRRETQRLNRIIEDLLQLSRLDRGRIALNLVALNLNALVSQYVTDRLPLAESLGLSLVFQPHPQLPHPFADEEMMGQVVSALLTNALNYTPDGGQIDVCTQIQSSDEAVWVGFCVRDTGPGIPPEEKGRLFERFFRGRIAQTTGVPGTGLGLALAHEILVRHGGRIEAESSGIAGEGVMFSVWLPLVTPAPLPAEGV